MNNEYNTIIHAEERINGLKYEDSVALYLLSDGIGLERGEKPLFDYLIIDRQFKPICTLEIKEKKPLPSATISLTIDKSQWDYLKAANTLILWKNKEDGIEYANFSNELTECGGGCAFGKEYVILKGFALWRNVLYKLKERIRKR